MTRAANLGIAVWLAVVLGTAGCYATMGYPVDEDYYDVPPPGFVATAPVYYYDGRPTYWYRGHWHYREGGHWQHYREEPPRLRDFRSQVAPPGPMNRGAPMAPGRMPPGRMAPAPGPGPGMPMQRGRMAPAPAPAPGPANRGRATPRMWERPGRLQR